MAPSPSLQTAHPSTLGSGSLPLSETALSQMDVNDVDGMDGVDMTTTQRSTTPPQQAAPASEMYGDIDATPHTYERYRNVMFRMVGVNAEQLFRDTICQRRGQQAIGGAGRVAHPTEIGSMSSQSFVVQQMSPDATAIGEQRANLPSASELNLHPFSTTPHSALAVNSPVDHDSITKVHVWVGLHQELPEPHERWFANITLYSPPPHTLPQLISSLELAAVQCDPVRLLFEQLQPREKILVGSGRIPISTTHPFNNRPYNSPMLGYAELSLLSSHEHCEQHVNGALMEHAETKQLLTMQGMAHEERQALIYILYFSPVGHYSSVGQALLLGQNTLAPAGATADEGPQMVCERSPHVQRYSYSLRKYY